MSLIKYLDFVALHLLRNYFLTLKLTKKNQKIFILEK